MKLISWNVNGIRAAIKKGFVDFIKKENPDILCLQETKAHKEQVDLNSGYPYEYWHSAEKKGYSGTAIFSKIKPLAVLYGIGNHEGEGRVITLEYDHFFLVNVYTPNSKRGLLRLENRQEWDKDFFDHLKKLEKDKPVIFTGDLNVAHNDIDLKNPDSNRNKTAGFTDQERSGFNRYMDNGFIDTFRQLYPDKVEYSWWSYMFQARMKNIGWRIDYFVVSESIFDKVKDSVILRDQLGSDHCPVKLEIDM